jgi:hypothetical protein
MRVARKGRAIPRRALSTRRTTVFRRRGARPLRPQGSDKVGDDVTKEDLQLVWKHIQALESGLKETTRLQGITEEFAKDINNNVGDHIKQNQDSFKKSDGRISDVEKRMSDLEKKVGKK